MKEKINYYPIALNLKGKVSLVIGGGKVSERKVRSLLESGARITLVSPEATCRLKHLSRSRKIKWIKRRVRSSDLKQADIIIAATSKPDVNDKVSEWAGKQNKLVNVVDRKELSSFISTAVFHNCNASISVYTHGKDPALSRDLKNFLKERWDEFLSYRSRL